MLENLKITKNHSKQKNMQSAYKIQKTQLIFDFRKILLETHTEKMRISIHISRHQIRTGIYSHLMSSELYKDRVKSPTDNMRWRYTKSTNQYHNHQVSSTLYLKITFHIINNTTTQKYSIYTYLKIFHF